MEPLTPLAETLRRLDALVEEQGLSRAELLNPRDLASRTCLSRATVRDLLNGGTAPADTVNDRVRERVKALADAYLARTGKPMSELAAAVSRQLGVSAFWARQVCTGEKMPSVELLHGLVRFFRVDGGEAFFTDEAPAALNRVLVPLLAQLATQSLPKSTDPLAVAWSRHDDVRGIALRRAHDLPPERWNVLNATLQALLDLDDNEEDQ
ncbi:helix-turn-helix domain-containing protein [Streptomyces chartreusis]|uniref:helix-turn-helix domain-containing protein n=1 Tax=Streptomyces chartreusis TaxID=1969 RepID=UPI00381C9470